MKKISQNLIISFGLSAAGFAGYLLFVRPRWLSWGTPKGEENSSLPGDHLIPNERLLLQTTRTLEIPAAAGEIWPWLVQIGQGRGGFYSYDWLENLFGLDIHSTDRILPQYQNLKVGDRIPFGRGAGVDVFEIEPECWLVLAGREPSGEIGGSWSFILKPTGRQSTRLIVRTRVAEFPPSWMSKIFGLVLLEPAHFIMERRMMLGIRDLVLKNRTD